MTLSPLRWQALEDLVITPARVAHRPSCRTGPHAGLRVAAGASIELRRPPTRCDRCYPEFELLLGPASAPATRPRT